MGSLKNTMKFFILKFVIVQCVPLNASNAISGKRSLAIKIKKTLKNKLLKILL
ncbi:hypothetical protein MMM110_12870 [Helicobacter pylori]